MPAQRRSALWFLLPAVALFALFSWLPIVNGFIYSFQRVPLNPNVDPAWIGWANYSRILQDPAFWVAWKNVGIFVGFSILIGFPVPIALAIALNELRRGRAFYRLMLYLPVVLPLVVVVYIWSMLYYPEIGVIDALLRRLGLEPVRWLENPHVALLALVIMTTWKWAGSTALIYLAALQGIPPQLYEAAEIDGASFWQRLWRVTLPQLRFVMVLVLLLQLIATSQVFTEPFLTTEGGPATAENPHGATLTVMLYIYNRAFLASGGLGEASAASMVLFLALLLCSAVYLAMTRRREAAA